MDFANFSNIFINAVYYVAATAITFFSVFGVYILVRYGQSKSLSLTIAIIYALFYFRFIFTTYHILQSLS